MAIYNLDRFEETAEPKVSKKKPSVLFKPMLAGTLDGDNIGIKFPVLASPKLDGIRCIVLKGKAVTRNLKAIPNDYIREQLEKIPYDLDGELVSGDTFQSSTSAVMSFEGKPDFTYYIFDTPTQDKAGFQHRFHFINTLKLPAFVKVVPHTLIKDEEDLLTYEQKCLLDGYEGVMIRSISGPYKQGRSTLREEYLLKLKRFADSEAKIVGFEPLYKNTNEAKINALGHTERSSAQEGKIAQEKLGKFIISWNGLEGGIGSGFTDEQRVEFWKNRNSLMGKMVKFKYQEFGVKEFPRFPVFIGFRDKRDM